MKTFLTAILEVDLEIVLSEGHFVFPKLAKEFRSDFAVLCNLRRLHGHVKRHLGALLSK